MFGWGVLKHGVLESVRFCMGDLPMYTFLIPTHPYYLYYLLHKFSVFCYMLLNFKWMNIGCCGVF